MLKEFNGMMRDLLGLHGYPLVSAWSAGTTPRDADARAAEDRVMPSSRAAQGRKRAFRERARPTMSEAAR
jgi:hypothetical protein